MGRSESGGLLPVFHFVWIILGCGGRGSLDAPPMVTVARNSALFGGKSYRDHLLAQPPKGWLGNAMELLHQCCHLGRVLLLVPVP